MEFTKQIAKHFRDVHFGGNWTFSNLKDNLTDITWEEAVTKVHSFNTIAVLVYHIGYYVEAQIKVLQGEALNAKDEESFSHPHIQSKEDWKKLVNKTLINAEKLADLIEALPDTKLSENFTDEKYGNYSRNFLGIIEHTHYHLGQIALIKKMVRQNSKNDL